MRSRVVFQVLRRRVWRRWKIFISGGHPEGEIMPITDFDDALAEAEQGLLDLVTAYLFGDAALNLTQTNLS